MAAASASVRFETEPGHQMRVDFGEKWVWIGERRTKVHLLAAVLGSSRRIYVKAFLSERQDDWREGIAGAFLHFGGVPHEVLGDNARALVTDRDRGTGHVRFNPAYLLFCRDWGVTPRACGPYRARTKGKVESGVKYVKRNGLAGRRFASFAELESHLAAWCDRVDTRVHRTTHERPADRFAVELAALRALPSRPDKCLPFPRRATSCVNCSESVFKKTDANSRLELRSFGCRHAAAAGAAGRCPSPRERRVAQGLPVGCWAIGR